MDKTMEDELKYIAISVDENYCRKVWTLLHSKSWIKVLKTSRIGSKEKINIGTYAFLKKKSGKL